jgi:hypothetical protein
MFDIIAPYYTYGWKNKKKPKSEFDNLITWQNELAGLITDALHRYKWDGLPPETSERVLEMCALTRGWFGIGDVDGAKLALMFAPDGRLNVNGDPAGAWGYGFNGFNKHFNVYVPGADENDIMKKTAAGYDINLFMKSNAVIQRSNMLAYPELFILIKAADRICDAMRSMDVIAKNCKFPTIITCDDRQVAEVQRMLNAIDDNAYRVIGLGALPFDTFKTFDTGANPESLLTLWEYRENVIGEAREKLGIISNPAAKKRERLIVDEVNANNMQAYINLDKGLEARQKFCDNVNALWGLNISVEIDTKAGDYDLTESEGTEDDSNETGFEE